MDKATVIGTVVAVLSLIATLVAWQWPQPTDAPAAKAAPTSAASSNVASPAAAKVSHLDAAGFPAESGGSNLVAVPREVRDKSEYADHPIAISCPSNQTGDKQREVTYVLRGRYLRFDAQVRPYYPAGSDQQSMTYVSAYTGVTQPDGDLQSKLAGMQQRATMTSPQQLTASVENAEKLTIRIECADPNGTVVLTAAGLTPA